MVVEEGRRAPSAKPEQAGVSRNQLMSVLRVVGRATRDMVNRRLTQRIDELEARLKQVDQLSTRLSAVEVCVGAVAMRMDVGDGNEGLEELKSLDSRIAQLEWRPILSYRGIWREDDDHRVGDFCTHDGSMWYWWQNHTKDRPGTSTAWQLVVKRGKDGKDAR